METSGALRKFPALCARPKKSSEGFPQLAGDLRRCAEESRRLLETSGGVRRFVSGLFLNYVEIRNGM
ncbi:hypothetical protein U9K52_02715 [Chryseobacterium sp. MHB01]|uniref:hypothetical protein n=1 Tax=Chryseobacterium sp. MHB01 TaxID=3109433 RepID=UPI002AFE29BB|nr:hypothetical protein [Chryseobacterium sp. MHB01]MEA1847813.1 hypothetical protein [Chryseobacterium sp. MHB01]